MRAHAHPNTYVLSLLRTNSSGGSAWTWILILCRAWFFLASSSSPGPDARVVLSRSGCRLPPTFNQPLTLIFSFPPPLLNLFASDLLFLFSPPPQKFSHSRQSWPPAHRLWLFGNTQKLYEISNPERDLLGASPSALKASVLLNGIVEALSPSRCLGSPTSWGKEKKKASKQKQTQKKSANAKQQARSSIAL